MRKSKATGETKELVRFYCVILHPCESVAAQYPGGDAGRTRLVAIKPKVVVCGINELDSGAILCHAHTSVRKHTTSITQLWMSIALVRNHRQWDVSQLQVWAEDVTK